MSFSARRGNASVSFPQASRIMATFALAVAALSSASAQTTLTTLAHPTSRIAAKVDNANRVTLAGNTHPLAKAANDRGAVDDASPMRRMMLTLTHTDDQETALKSLISAQQDRNNPLFHQWLTPEQYGAQFGVSDSDLQAVTTWLTSQGFTIGKVAAGRNVIEFSGTAGQVKTAFATEIHKYEVNGVMYQANAKDPSIPAALAPVVKGVVSLYNFPRAPHHSLAGSFERNKATGVLTKLSANVVNRAATASSTGAPALGSPDAKPKPNFTFPESGETYYALTPYDIATIYNVLPLWNAGIDGTGQTIAILQETNIHIDDVRAFRSLFGLPANDPIVVLNGPDPGVTAYDEGEADIDVEWSGAIAKGATIKLIASASTEASAGTDLSAEYAIDNNVASVTSLSYGECELGLGASGNAFYNILWQQGASQGISHFVSTGDSGSASCDDGSTTGAEFGLSVSGMASTPYNTGVGGTDFLGTFFSPSTFFSATNNPTTQASALSYIPETTWNNTCTNPFFTSYDGYATNNAACKALGIDYEEVAAGGGSGGQSNCINGNGSTQASCSQGYAKPSWQTGVGVPADGVRDLPDVSLMASNGFFGSFYVVCQEDANTDGKSCNVNSPYADFQGYGGTSISTPEFAGIMALINQKTNARQGLANYVFYDLFNKQTTAGTACTSAYSAGTTTTATPIMPAAGCVFNDITFGSNGNTCVKGSPDCVVTTGYTYGILTTPATDAPANTEGFLNTVGYDMAAGLGSVNVTNLVNSWASVTFVPTTTTLALSSTTFAHGSSVNATIGVTPSSSGTGTPTGNVNLLTSTTPSSLGYVALTANGSGVGSGVVGSYNDLPGGTYTVSAYYTGDGTFASSTSTPVSVTVTPETSTVTGAAYLENESTGAISSVTSAAYGAQVYISMQVAGASGNGVPTGSVLFKNGTSTFGTFALNSNGEATDGTSTLPPGTYSFTGAYSGDSSFAASSTSAATALTITKSATTTKLTVGTKNPAAGASETLTGTVVGSTSLANGGAFGAPASGTVSFYSGTTLLGTSSFTSTTVSTTTGATSSIAKLVTVLPSVTTGTSSDSITAVYSGDNNYNTSTSTATVETVGQAAKTATTSTLTATNTPLTYGGSTTLTSTLTYTSTNTPTGTVSFYVDGIITGTAVTISGGTASTAVTGLTGGFHTITAQYAGDTNFLGSTGSLSTTVAPAATALSLTGSTSTALQGSTVTFTAKIPYTAPAEPTGSITFAVDGVTTITIAANAFNTGGVGAYFNSAQLTPGAHSIVATYSGDKNYAGSTNSTSVTISAAPFLSLSVAQRTAIVLGAPVTINVQAQTLTTGPIPTGNITYTVDGGASSAAIALSSLGTASFTLSGLNELQHTVVVTYAGNGTYTSVSQTIILNGDVSQVILFRGLANRTFAVAPTLTLAARATSGLPVTYTVTGPATLSGSTLTLTGTGTVTVTASQAGNSSFAAATPVTRSFTAQ